VVNTATSFAGKVWDVDTERVDLSDGVVTRDFVRHPGAVAVIAYDGAGAIYLVNQYRHPVRRELWEPPAGLLDVADEDPLLGAKRELAEEAYLTAATWHVLADFYTSPGGSSEAIRIYLARDFADVPEAERFAREAEELEMTGEWVPLAEVLDAISAGRAGCPTLVVGAYALDAALRSGEDTLRPADSQWPGREGIPT
jgi:ADP-ribose pyrophosphatase